MKRLLSMILALIAYLGMGFSLATRDRIEPASKQSFPHLSSNAFLPYVQYDCARLCQNLSKNPRFEVQTVFNELVLDRTRQNRRATNRFTEDFNAELDKISHQKPASIRSRAATQAYADEQISYTNVMEDLEKDESFNAEDYPAIADDYSLQVIQIAESVNGELFVYVYQPSDDTKDLTATTVRISQSIGENARWKDYDLTLLNTDGVFDKYRVEGISILSDVVRYYDIAAIHRAFDSEIDDSADMNYDQTINEVVYEVAQEWHACTINGVVSYSMITSETITITITNKIVGYIQYSEGFKLYVDRCDSHFVAFSTDREIDDLMEADLEYTTQSYITIVKTGDDEPTLGEKVSKNAITVKASDEVSNDADGLFGKKYTWNRIEKVEDFIVNEGEDLNLTTGNLEDLEDMDWILRFAETDFTSTVGMYAVNEGTLVSEVTILRLKFQTDGVTYNLGVVDNKQTGSKDPFASADTYLDDLEESAPNWAILIAVLALCLLFPILYPLVSAIVEFLIWLRNCLSFQCPVAVWENEKRL